MSVSAVVAASGGRTVSALVVVVFGVTSIASPSMISVVIVLLLHVLERDPLGHQHGAALNVDRSRDAVDARLHEHHASLADRLLELVGVVIAGWLDGDAHDACRSRASAMATAWSSEGGHRGLG